MPFFNVLPEVEQQKFMKLVAKVNTAAKVTSSKNKAILKEEEAIQYLITKHFNKNRK